ncbi:hypothetical protein CTI12_AA375070 [Artemisia annua]|uniref:Homologous recombination OB-fold protein OB-fold domain-containing protein n=1 Tax=Artemisia annua TaxID=35608 RepID=A0A2U1MIV6_ARTAN|nr:hypothetical protein CTI12_AA375070 [Artemisia annua]
MSQQNKTEYTKGYHNSQCVPPKPKRDTTYRPQHNVGGSSTSSNNPVRIIPSPADILQAVFLRKNSDIREGGLEYSVVPTQQYVRKINEDLIEDDHFTRGPWLSVIHKLNAEGVIVTGCLGDIKSYCRKGKLELVVVVINACTPNALGELIVTLKDHSGTMSGTIHHKVLTEEAGYKNSIQVGVVLVLRNVSVFTPKSSPPCLNITKSLQKRRVTKTHSKSELFWYFVMFRYSPQNHHPMS